MIEHGLKGFAAQAFFTQPARVLPLAGVEGGEDFLNVQRRNAMSELFLFMWAAK